MRRRRARAAFLSSFLPMLSGRVLLFLLALICSDHFVRVVSAQLVPHIVEFSERPDLNTTGALSRLRWFLQHRLPDALKCDPYHGAITHALHRYGHSATNLLAGASIYESYLTEMRTWLETSLFSHKLSVLQNFVLQNGAHFEAFCRPMAFLSQIFKVLGLGHYHYVQSKNALEVMDAQTWQRVQEVFNVVATLFIETGPEQDFFRELSTTSAVVGEAGSDGTITHPTELGRVPRQLLYTLHPSSMAGMRRMFLVLQESRYPEVAHLMPPTLLQAYGRFVEVRRHLMRLFTVHHPQWVYHVLPLDNMEMTITNRATAGDECVDRTATMFEYERGRDHNFYRLFRDGVAELLGKVHDISSMDATVARAMRLKSEAEYVQIERDAAAGAGSHDPLMSTNAGAAGGTEDRANAGAPERPAASTTSSADGKTSTSEHAQDGSAGGKEAEAEAASSAGSGSEHLLPPPPNLNRMTHYLLMTDPTFTFPACTPAVMLALLVYINKLFEEAIQLMLQNQPLASWAQFLKYAHHLINRVYLPSRNKYAIPNWHRWIAGGANLDWIGLIRVAENRMMSKKEILYGQKINRVEERRDVCAAEGHCLTEIDPEAYDGQMERVFHLVADELEKLGLEYWPAGGTMIGALRWGRIAGRLSGGPGQSRFDVIDDDLEFMIGIHNEDQWLDVSAELSQVFTNVHGAGMCHQTFSLHSNNHFWTNYVRQDLLACGWYKPYAIGVELRSYVVEKRLNFAYLFRMGGPGYSPWCDAEQYAGKKEYKLWVDRDLVRRRTEAERNALEEEWKNSRDGGGSGGEGGAAVAAAEDESASGAPPEELKARYEAQQAAKQEEQRVAAVKKRIEENNGNAKIFDFNPWTLRKGTGAVPRFLEVLKRQRRLKSLLLKKSEHPSSSTRHGKHSSFKVFSASTPDGPSDDLTTSTSRSTSALFTTPPVNPLCYLQQMPVFQSWNGFLPLQNYLYPLQNCTLFDRVIPCPYKSLEILHLFNGAEYQNPGFSLAIPYLAGRNLHRDPRMKGLETDVLNERDFVLLYERAKELHAKNLLSFYPMYSYEGAADITEGEVVDAARLRCDGLTFQELAKRAGDHLKTCPPAKVKDGLEDYEDDFHF